MRSNLYHERRTHRARRWRALAVAALVLAVAEAAVMVLRPPARPWRTVVIPEANAPGKAVPLCGGVLP